MFGRGRTATSSPPTSTTSKTTTSSTTSTSTRRSSVGLPAIGRRRAGEEDSSDKKSKTRGKKDSGKQSDEEKKGGLFSRRKKATEESKDTQSSKKQKSDSKAKSTSKTSSTSKRSSKSAKELPTESRLPRNATPVFTADRQLDILGAGLMFLSLLMVAGLLQTTLSTNAAAQGLTAQLDRWLAQFFGLGRIVLPIASGIVGWELVRRFFGKIPELDYWRISGFILLYGALLATLHWWDLFFDGFPNINFVPDHETLREQGRALYEEGGGGGFFGYFLYITIHQMLGDWGTEVVMGFAWFFGAYLAFDLSFEKIANRQLARRHEREARRATVAVQQPVLATATAAAVTTVVDDSKSKGKKKAAEKKKAAGRQATETATSGRTEVATDAPITADTDGDQPKRAIAEDKTGRTKIADNAPITADTDGDQPKRARRNIFGRRQKPQEPITQTTQAAAITQATTSAADSKSESPLAVPTSQATTTSGQRRTVETVSETKQRAGRRATPTTSSDETTSGRRGLFGRVGRKPQSDATPSTPDVVSQPKSSTAEVSSQEEKAAQPTGRRSIGDEPPKAIGRRPPTSKPEETAKDEAATSTAAAAIAGGAAILNTESKSDAPTKSAETPIPARRPSSTEGESPFGRRLSTPEEKQTDSSTSSGTGLFARRPSSASSAPAAESESVGRRAIPPSSPFGRRPSEPEKIEDAPPSAQEDKKDTSEHPTSPFGKIATAVTAGAIGASVSHEDKPSTNEETPSDTDQSSQEAQKPTTSPFAPRSPFGERKPTVTADGEEVKRGLDALLQRPSPVSTEKSETETSSPSSEAIAAEDRKADVPSPFGPRSPFGQKESSETSEVPPARPMGRFKPRNEDDESTDKSAPLFRPRTPITKADENKPQSPFGSARTSSPFALPTEPDQASEIDTAEDVTEEEDEAIPAQPARPQGLQFDKKPSLRRPMPRFKVDEEDEAEEDDDDTTESDTTVEDAVPSLAERFAKPSETSDDDIDEDSGDDDTVQETSIASKAQDVDVAEDVDDEDVDDEEDTSITLVDEDEDENAEVEDSEDNDDEEGNEDEDEDEDEDEIPQEEPERLPIPAERGRWKMPDYRAILEKGSQRPIDQDELLRRARLIEDTLESFGAPGRVVEVNTGPVITQFGIEPNYIEKRGGGRSRVKVSAIASLDRDLALALAAKSIRIEAPVPGKGYVGIEVPNVHSEIVSLRDVMDSPQHAKLLAKSTLTIGLGKRVDGGAVSADLTQMPHLLIAGATGSGKSVCVNAIIACLLLQNSPEDLQFIMVDPKRVELAGYNGIPHLVAPVVVDLERIVGVLKWVQREMDDRYKRFASVGARHILDYNAKIGPDKEKMPYLIVIVDELADLMMLAPDETERLLARLAQMARATGIHLIISTQRPSVDVVTGLIKANFPARIAFAVAASVDSRVILDQPGAEKLLGRGDMLYQAPDSPAPLRLQGVYVSDPEINRITQFWKSAQAIAHQTNGDIPKPKMGVPLPGERREPASQNTEIGKSSGSVFTITRDKPATPKPTKSAEEFWQEVEEVIEEDDNDTSNNSDTDELYEEAVELVKKRRKASISMLQRHFRIGYTRAARLIDMMEAEGIVGPAESGAKPREVLV